MKKILNKLKARRLIKKGYETLTITIDGKVEYIGFYKV